VALRTETSYKARCYRTLGAGTGTSHSMSTKMSQHTVRAASQSLRSIHSSAAVRAAVAADGSVTLPPMFDIFDVPVRLRKSAAPAPEQSRRHATPSPSLSGRALNPMATPTSLPHPLVFEGPAGRRPVMRRHHEIPQHRVSAYAPQRGSEPVITIFDGPAHSGGRTQRPHMGGQTVRISRNLPAAASY
jgi:hypothetical protein